MDRIGAAASFGSPCAGFAHTHEINPWHRPRLGSTRPPAAQARGSGSKPSPNTPSSADSTRRSVLAAPAAAGLANWLLVAQPGEAIREVETPDGRSVQAWEFDVPLRVVALRGSVPAQWVADFRIAAGPRGQLKLQQRPQLQALYDELSSGRGKDAVRTADTVTVSDAWLGPAIQAGLIRPGLLYPRWRRLVRRNARGAPSSDGRVWGSPYRWGCTLVAYRSDLLLRRDGLAFTDWPDLLQPRLRGRVAFIESPRELVGVALKTLGLSYNARLEDFDDAGVTLDQLEERLKALHRQVRLFSQSEARRALASGDVYAWVGPSEELLPAAASSSNVRIVAPASGTALWADLWVVPAAAGAEDAAAAAREDGQQLEPSPLLPMWMEFALQPVRAQRRKALQRGASPLLLPEPQQEAATSVGPAGKLEEGDLPPEQVLQRSEFLEPLVDGTQNLYTYLLSGLQSRGGK